MGILADQILLQFTQDSFVENLLRNELDLLKLFNQVYEVEDIEVREIKFEDFKNLKNRRFQKPIFETLFIRGVEERTSPTSERTQINHALLRYGRLIWVDVFLEILVSTKIHTKVIPIKSITIKDLIEELGGVDSLNELRSKLETRYSKSIVDAFFEKLHINTVEDFKQQRNIFLEFVGAAPPPYDPNDPANVRSFPLNICVKFQTELKIVEALQEAKLCREILENKKEHRETFDGGEIKSPCAFVIVFPESIIVDNAIPSLNKIQIKDYIHGLFELESMFVHFLSIN